MTIVHPVLLYGKLLHLLVNEPLFFFRNVKLHLDISFSVFHFCTAFSSSQAAYRSFPLCSEKSLIPLLVLSPQSLAALRGTPRKGLGLSQQAFSANGYSFAVLAIYSIPHRKTVFVACSFDFGHKKRLQPPRAEISRFPYCEVTPLLFRLPLSLLPLRLYSVCPYCSYRLAARQTTAVRWIFRVAVRKEKLIYRNMMPGHKIIEHL